MNLVGRDGENGPVLVSVKAETVAGQEHWRVLLRLRAGSTHDLVPAANLSPNPTPAKMVKVKPFTRELHLGRSRREFDERLKERAEF